MLTGPSHDGGARPEDDTGPEAPVRVVIADDVPEIRQLLRRVLSHAPGFRVVGEAVDGQGAVELAATLQPDALLLDLAMPVMDGLSAIARSACAPREPRSACSRGARGATWPSRPPTSAPTPTSRRGTRPGS